ncbi:hypothetical protein Tco_1387731 [Tanacetum coccineum]
MPRYCYCLGRKAHLLGDKQIPTFRRHLEEIHVTWAQFWKKSDKMAIRHEDKVKIQDQAVETPSRKTVTPSGNLSDTILINCDAVWISRQ